MDFNFGSDGGPIMSGHWYNPKTGDSFTVKDTYFEDNNMIVMTTDGRRLDYNIIQNYIKTDKPMPAKKLEQKHTVRPVKDDIPDEVKNILADAESELDNLIGSNGNISSDKPTNDLERIIPKQNLYKQEVDEDSLFINRILKRATEPSFKFNITWNNFPNEQLHMLDMMAVPVEKIIDFYISKINLEEVRKEIAESIEKYINNKVNKEEEIAKEEKPVVSKPVVEKPAVAKENNVKKVIKKPAKNTKK